jgi:hypothetical protein
MLVRRGREQHVDAAPEPVQQAPVEAMVELARWSVDINAYSMPMSSPRNSSTSSPVAARAAASTAAHEAAVENSRDSHR